MDILSRAWQSSTLTKLDNMGRGHVEFESLLIALTLRGKGYARKTILSSLRKRKIDITAILLQADTISQGIWLPDALALELVALMHVHCQEWMKEINVIVFLGECTFSMLGGVSYSKSISTPNTISSSSTNANNQELSVASDHPTFGDNLILRAQRVLVLPDSLESVLILARKENLPAGNLLFAEEDVNNTGRERVPQFQKTVSSRVPELEYNESEEPMLHIDDWMTSRKFIQNVAQITSCTPLTGILAPVSDIFPDEVPRKAMPSCVHAPKASEDEHTPALLSWGLHPEKYLIQEQGPAGISADVSVDSPDSPIVTECLVGPAFKPFTFSLGGLGQDIEHIE
jgi:hypothetical protein